MSKEMKTSDWVRGLRVIVGFIALAAGIAVLVLPGLAVFTLLFLLAFALIFLGVARIIHSVDAKHWSKGHRALHAIVGVLALVLGALVFALPAVSVLSLVFLLAFALLAYGLVSLAIGGSIAAKVLSKWTRALLVIVGALSILFSIIVLASPALGVLSLIAILSVSFLLNGVESIISGIE